MLQEDQKKSATLHLQEKRHDSKIKNYIKKKYDWFSKGQIATVKGLGLKKINSSVVREATPETLGMIKKIKHLVITENN